MSDRGLSDAAGRRAAPLLRLIDDGARAPAVNMAIDEALLRQPGPAVLRLYGWRPHAVSLGYFQPLAAFADLPPGTEVVRRSTGGGAIWHGDELTFALTADQALLPRALDATYALLHDALLLALADVGVAAVRVPDGTACGARPASRWCFEHPGRHDLVDGSGRKLVGSAQRRIQVSSLREAGPARVLHHGSIVLQRPAHTPFVAAIADHVDAIAAAPALRAAAAARMAAALGASVANDALTAAELAAADGFAAARFSAASFLAAR